jgi:hypothetical protein
VERPWGKVTRCQLSFCIYVFLLAEHDFCDPLMVSVAHEDVDYQKGACILLVSSIVIDIEQVGPRATHSASPTMRSEKGDSS